MKSKKSIIGVVIIIINILLEITYLILSKTLIHHNVQLRQWVISAVYLNRFIFVIVLASLVTSAILKRYKGNVYVISLHFLILIPTTIFISLSLMFMYAFSVEEEALTYRQGKLYIAVANHIGFHHTEIEFYESVNPIMMKKTDLEGFTYDGSYNYYDNTNSIDLDVPYLNLYIINDFEGITPWEVKEKLGIKQFVYLGNYTYDFGKLIAKFNDRESKIERAIIKDDIVVYKDKHIIGENIDIVKKYIEDIESNTGVGVDLKEFIDKNNCKNIVLTTVSNDDTKYPTIHFIADYKDNIIEVRYYDSQNLQN